MDGQLRRRAPVPPQLRPQAGSEAPTQRSQAGSDLGGLAEGVGGSAVEDIVAVRERVRCVLQERANLLGADMLVSAYYNALHGSKAATLCVPMPPTHCDWGSSLEASRNTAGGIPGLVDLHESPSRLDHMPSGAVRMLDWIIGCGGSARRTPGSRRGAGAVTYGRAVPASALPAALGQAVKGAQRPPSIIVELVRDPSLPDEFDGLAAQHGTALAFHGSAMDNWHSIIRNGLQILSGTVLESSGSLYGSGVYLSTDITVCENFAPVGSNWPRSAFGQRVSVIAAVQAVRHPSVLSGLTDGSAVPAFPHGATPAAADAEHKYLICPNPTTVRVTHLLIYMDRGPTAPASAPVGAHPLANLWTKLGGMTCLVVLYLAMLLLVAWWKRRPI